MSRIRTVKPDFFRHEELFDAEKSMGLPLRLAFVSLWTVADREGRFKWRPRALKAECLPYDDIDFSAVLDALTAAGFILKYEIDGESYGCIPTWKKHQAINTREAQSTLPSPDDGAAVHMQARAVDAPIPNGINVPGPLRQTVLARDGFKCRRCNATDDLTVDHIFPQSTGGTHAINNLRCLCRKCNSARPVQGQALIDDLAKDGLTFDDMARICMHVHAQGEGKGREGKGREGECIPSSLREEGTPSRIDPKSDLYRRGKEILGDGSGGLLTKLLKAKGNSVPRARAALEEASTAGDCREYLGAIIRSKEHKTEQELRDAGEIW